MNPSVERVLKRTAERKAAGLIPDYCQHSGRTSKKNNTKHVPLCLYVGAPAGPKGFHLCDHPDEPLGAAIVCACRGCGLRCPGYTTKVPDGLP